MYKQWIKQAERQGWRKKKIKNGLLLIPPDGDAVALHSNHRRREEGHHMVGIKSQLKRAGLKIE